MDQGEKYHSILPLSAVADSHPVTETRLAAEQRPAKEQRLAAEQRPAKEQRLAAEQRRSRGSGKDDQTVDSAPGVTAMCSSDPRLNRESRVHSAFDASETHSGIVSRRVAEVALLWPSLVEALPTPVLVVDDEGRILVMNRATATLVGVAAARYIGYSVGRLLSLEKVQIAQETLSSDQVPFRFRDVLHLDESEIDVIVDATLLRVSGQVLTCLTLQDESDRFREDAEWAGEPDTVHRSLVLSPERLHLAHRFETLGHLTGSLAHEFNNLLSVILGSLELAERSIATSADPGLDLKRAMIAAERSAETINQILRYSRRRETEVEPVQPADVIDELAGLLERTLGKSTHLIFDVVMTSRVLATVSELENALLNLVINARDAVGSDGEVTIGCKERELLTEEAAVLGVEPGRYVSVTVTDNGVGVPDSVRARVFEPFFTTKTEGRGTGLGLSTVRSFARKSAGGVLLDSRKGVGTKVEILLPVIP